MLLMSTFLGNVISSTLRTPVPPELELPIFVDVASDIQVSERAHPNPRCTLSRLASPAMSPSNSSRNTAASPGSLTTSHPTSPSQNSEDDIFFDEDIHEGNNNPTNPSSSSSNIQSNDTDESPDIRRLRGTHTTAGYRDGISASKEKSLQPGFDEGYPLGAVFGLRVGWVLGVLEGIRAALMAKPAREDVGGKDVEGAERLCREAREALRVEKLFAPPWWKTDGTWGYEVEGEERGEEVIFKDVAEQHPVVREWVGRTKAEMEKWGLREDVFAGVEWEAGRVE